MPGGNSGRPGSRPWWHPGWWGYWTIGISAVVPSTRRLGEASGDLASDNTIPRQPTVNDAARWRAMSLSRSRGARANSCWLNTADRHAGQPAHDGISQGQATSRLSPNRCGRKIFSTRTPLGPSAVRDYGGGRVRYRGGRGDAQTGNSFSREEQQRLANANLLQVASTPARRQNAARTAFGAHRARRACCRTVRGPWIAGGSMIRRHFRRRRYWLTA